MRVELLEIVENAYSELAVLWQSWGVWVFNVSAGDGDAAQPREPLECPGPREPTNDKDNLRSAAGRDDGDLHTTEAAGLSLAWSSQPL